MSHRGVKDIIVGDVIQWYWPFLTSEAPDMSARRISNCTTYCSLFWWRFLSLVEWESKVLTRVVSPLLLSRSAITLSANGGAMSMALYRFQSVQLYPFRRLQSLFPCHLFAKLCIFDCSIDQIGLRGCLRTCNYPGRRS
jgi:hypothetical protein